MKKTSIDDVMDDDVIEIVEAFNKLIEYYKFHHSYYCELVVKVIENERDILLRAWQRELANEAEKNLEKLFISLGGEL